MNKWLTTPQFFDQPEPALLNIAPKGARINGPHTIPDRSARSLARLHRPIKKFVRETLAAGARPVSLAGDCCTAIPVLAAICETGQSPALVWLDAHGDFNTPKTSPSGFVGGMPLAMIVGRGPQDICTASGLAPFPESRVWLIDARDLDPAERTALDKSAVNRAQMSDLATLRINAPVHLHLDIDVLDATAAPGTNYPVPAGPSLAETVAACATYAAANQIVAISVSGWTTALDVQGTTQNACARVLAALGA